MSADPQHIRRVVQPEVQPIPTAGVRCDVEVSPEQLATHACELLRDLRERAPDCDAVYLCGAPTASSPFVAAFEAAWSGPPVWWARTRDHAGERGGLALLVAEGPASGAILDIGSTAVRVSMVSRQVVRRVSEPCPVGADGLDLAAFAANVVASALLSAPPPAPVLVVALPGDMEPEGLLLADCPVPGWSRNPELVPRLVDELRERITADPKLGSHYWRQDIPWHVLVLSRAELGGWSARQEVKDARRTLVLRLGRTPAACVVTSS